MCEVYVRNRYRVTRLGGGGGELLIGAIQKCDQLDAFLVVYKKEGMQDLVSGSVFIRWGGEVLGGGKYCRAYGALIFLESFLMGARPACLTGCTFYELFVKNSRPPVLYVGPLLILPRKEVDGGSPG